MPETREDLHPTRNGERDWGSIAKRALAVLLPVIAASITTKYQASGDAAARAQSAKQLAEDGFQKVRERVTTLERQVWVLETAARANQVAAPPPRRTGTRRAPPAPAVIPVTVTPRPKPLPANLDEVQRQINRPNASAPPTIPKTDATPTAP